jgi:hypothetical protein
VRIILTRAAETISNEKVGLCHKSNQFPDGRQTGNYPETGFAEIGRTNSTPWHNISPKPTSGPCRWESALFRASTEGHRCYCSFAYSALACLKIGMSGSAFFQSVRKS